MSELSSLDLQNFLEDIREYLEALQEAAGVAEVAAREKAEGEADDVASDFLYCVYDQRHLVQRPKRKWYVPDTKIGDFTGSTRLTKKRGICFHHTAVHRGFGADRALVQHYQKLASQAPEVPMEAFMKSSRELTPAEYARAIALAHRYRGDPAREYNYGVPYHAILAANSVLYLNLPFDWVTWHGDGANNWYLGVAWDARSTHESPAAEDLIADVVSLYELGREEGHFERECEFTIHAAWTRKPTDPGAEFIETVMVPAAKELGATIQLDFKVSTTGSRSIAQVLAA